VKDLKSPEKPITITSIENIFYFFVTNRTFVAILILKKLFCKFQTRKKMYKIKKLGGKMKNSLLKKEKTKKLKEEIIMNC